MGPGATALPESCENREIIGSQYGANSRARKIHGVYIYISILIRGQGQGGLVVPSTPPWMYTGSFIWLNMPVNADIWPYNI